MGKITEEDAKKIADINAQQAKFNQTVAETTNEFTDFQKAFNGVSDDIKKQVIIEAAKQLGEFTTEAKKGGEQIKSLKAELRELKAQIASGTLGEKEMKEATKRAAELTDHLGDVQQKIRALSSDTKRIDAVVEAFRGIAAGVAVAQGAMALFGKENKELEKSVLKVQAAMTLLQGVQELANLATGEGIVKTYALAASERVAAVASKALGVEISAATALATGGLTLLLSGVAYLAVEMSNAEHKTEDFSKAIERMNNNIESQRRVNDLLIQRMAEGRKRDLIEAKLHTARLLDDLTTRFRESKISGIQYEKEYAAIRMDGYRKLAEINKKYDDEEIKKQKEKSEKINKVIEEAAKARLNFDKQLQEESKKIADDEELRIAKSEQEKLLIIKSREAEKLKNLYNLSNKTIDDKNALDSGLLNLEKKYNADVKAIDDKAAKDEAEQNEKDWQAAQEWMDKEIAAVAKTEEEKSAIRKKADEARLEAEKKLQEQLQAAIFSASQTALNTLFTLTQQNIQSRESEEIASIERKRDSELKNKDITEAQKQKIQERADRQIAIAKRNAWKAQQNADLAQAVLNGALAVTNALATVKPFPAAIIAAGLAGIQTAAQVAIIKNTPVPKFAKGVEKLNGAGTETSDSILAMLSKNERVVPADVNNDYFPALSAIHNRKVDHTLANSVLTDLANGTFNVTQEQNISATIDYNRLEQALSKGKSKVVINLDEKGFSHYQSRSAGTTNYINKKFKYEV